MTDLNRPARLNRTLLVLTGIVLLAVGGFAVGTHFGRIPLLDPGATLVPGTAMPPGWVWYAVAGAAVVVGLLALRWLIAQPVRKPKSHTWRFDQETGETSLAASAAVEPFTAEVATYPGVHAAHATLGGTQDAPVLAVVLSAEQDGDLAAIRERIADEGLPRLRQALDLAELPMTIEFRFSAKTGSRIQ
ncbi:alkaline shock response membrane anchor protein AmaP [Amycolatopsis roodepoortensis]|uniref:alkaline shock response membrane anchor protein AmaP n=1 Tax=Amycolatopsis roodepoortensis TaxID=700274 RepID=UPI00214D0259|nr:alkaline shock response membrane anchor protein AmaP [Amycolatopsis roodepoortensis]UUV30710.1 alkaline shock response membrane anchor protein AmaP [Amycolatopsis roodepoortensis]